MKLRFIGKYDGPVNCLGVEQKVSHGDIVELDEYLSEKALSTGEYEKVRTTKKKVNGD